jgi:cell division FtsZ-interacting protein ZapD
MGKRKPKPYSAKGRKLQQDREARLIATIREKLEHIPDGTCQPDMDRINDIINSGLTKSNKISTYKRRIKHK